MLSLGKRQQQSQTTRSATCQVMNGMGKYIAPASLAQALRAEKPCERSSLTPLFWRRERRTRVSGSKDHPLFLNNFCNNNRISQFFVTAQMAWRQSRAVESYGSDQIFIGRCISEAQRPERRVAPASKIMFLTSYVHPDLVHEACKLDQWALL